MSTEAHSMSVGVRYVVTKASEHGDFLIGDRIRLCEDGAIECVEAQGWMAEEDVLQATRGMAVEIDLSWLEQQRAKLTAALYALAEPAQPT